MPDTPTLKEAGFPEHRSALVVRIVRTGRHAARGGRRRFQRDVAAVLNDPEFKARFIDGPGFTGVVSTPEAFAKFIEEDFAYKKNLISVTGITAD